MGVSELRPSDHLDRLVLGHLSFSGLRSFGSALILLSSFAAQAGTFVLDLTSSTYFDVVNSTGVWDTGFATTGRIWSGVAPNLAPPPAANVDFGDGRDGAFLDGPAQIGITVSGATVTIDTDAKSVFRFTSFTLTGTLNVVGSQPLVIRVLGSTTISGTLNANGTAGADNSGAGATAGGTGRASGGNGGIGGIFGSQAPTNGSPNSLPNLQGGLTGTNQTTGADDEGGGGACNGADVITTYNATPGNTIGPPLSNAGGCTTTRANIAKGLESLFQGGTGGGGGGGFKVLPAFYYNGGGGGGGGGAIHIASVGRINLSGSLNAKGGNGGSVTGDGTHCGGGGGGGSGGTVWLQTLGAITGAGTVNISGGSGGAQACGANDSSGGQGSRGVFRVDTSDGTHSLTIAPVVAADSANTVLPLSGSQTTVVTSKAIPFNDGFYALSTPTVTTGCDAGPSTPPQVVYEGSNDGVNFENAVSGSQISDLNDYLYLRFKATFTATGATTKCITGLSIPYVPRELRNLTLKGGLACGSLRKSGNSNGNNPSSPWSILGDWVLLAIACFYARARAVSARIAQLPLT